MDCGGAKSEWHSGLPHTITHEQFVQPEIFRDFGSWVGERVAAFLGGGEHDTMRF